MILVEGKAELRSKLGYAPIIRANLTNLDSERAQIHIEYGGDYRGISRANHWRIQVTDSDNRAVAERVEWDMGGFSTMRDLDFGESIPTTLSVREYVNIEKPGTYTMVVMYHPTLRIGCAADTRGLLCVQSIPIKLEIKPIEIETNEKEQAEISRLITKLSKAAPVKILGGAYTGSEAAEFLPKDSPAGQLKLASWKAVPALIRAANSDKITPVQRAWVLGLLFGITDRNNPIDTPAVLGAFQYRHTGWVSFGSDPGEGFSTSQMSMDVETGEIAQKEQMEFASRWKPWIEKEYVRLKIVAPATQPN
jgi:hypothetical protein